MLLSQALGIVYNFTPHEFSAFSYLLSPGFIDECLDDIGIATLRKRRLPKPATLSDVVREIEYWRELCWLRNFAAKELDNQYGDGERQVNNREKDVETKLATIRPVSRDEVIEVFKWLLQQNDNLMDRGKLTKSIFLNLVGECENA